MRQNQPARIESTMRPCARAALMLLPLALSLVNVDAGTDYGIPLEIKLWDTGRTPLSHMVDVTNEFGLKVLAEHNFLNDDNIAFSPYGLMGILVALYEGVDGESSYQIQRGMQLPWNRNVMRVGFRDIHRTLKTYFVPEEGFLAGLALNNENVTFNENYKQILRFYGFDLENDKLPSFPANNSTIETSTSSNVEDATSTVTTSLSTAGREEPATVPAREETTANPNAETLNDIDIRSPTIAPTTANIGNINVLSTTDALTTTIDLTTTSNVRSSMPTIETTTATVTIETLQSTTIETTTLTTLMNNSTESITTLNSNLNLEVETPAISDQILTTDTLSSEISTASITTGSTNVFLTTSTMQVAETVTTEQSVTASDTSLVGATSIPGTSESTIEPLERRKKSIVSYMEYDAVLAHAQLAHLEAAALRLPLDSARYYLLALLPARADAAALPRLLARLARRSDLRDVYAALRPTRVRARIPSFTVKGHVILTADLQKLGIRDVFEPRQRDFAPMTPQPGVYVRSVEQAVSVALRRRESARGAGRGARAVNVTESVTLPRLPLAAGRCRWGTSKSLTKELEIVIGEEHISFTTSKTGSLLDVNQSRDPEGLRGFYYLLPARGRLRTMHDARPNRFTQRAALAALRPRTSLNMTETRGACRAPPLF
ncbi:hypothetical protein MSG28_000552 [Choristoneura fumiferana]|uniref:Uncharacterized protein n=1 Tax=Choristoneura fumiferana TaxID=7141 RepID=A0ACC0K1P2_CHOFU|nr:hypothetical protein MSG28_000552 [Choristoneura fumiferana]